MFVISSEDFTSPEGREKVAQFLNGVQETLNDLIRVNQQALIESGKAYAKPENLDFQ